MLTDAKDRSQITRAIEWQTQTRAGGHQRISDETFGKNMPVHARYEAVPLTDAILQNLKQRLTEGIKVVKRFRGDVLCCLEPPDGRCIVAIPERSCQLI
ncbi:hypothetical protein [Muricoccus pecuniae]|uniref:Uncharacterized protein n=1 Tax=Muricoccus pecuniae TaxID=693023 RepID=A0A840XVF5_9PROT|nr:hypothetical protein [Roseomonas pecuniae]MBB5692505.1 hypothetical protein [Roseomonas pecuniae]